jgi:chromosome partitioning protein
MQSLPRSIEFKNSTANQLLGMDLHPRQLIELVGRPKPPGQHHMRYTPADMRDVWFRQNSVPSPSEWKAGTKLKPPTTVVSRMTKGGVGKTSISINLACVSAMMGYRVLVIDADPQATASNLLGLDTSDPAFNCNHVGNFLLRTSKEPDADLPSSIYRIYEGGFLDLLPADINMARADQSLISAIASHSRADLFLSRNSDYLSKNYDLIVVDTAPGTTPVGLAFTYAARHVGKVMAVVEPEGSCIKALDVLQSNLDELENAAGAKVDMYIVVNKYQPGPKHIKQMMPFLWENHSKNLCESIISSYLGFSRQFDTKGGLLPLVELEPSSPGAASIIDATKSILDVFGATMDRRA